MKYTIILILCALLLSFTVHAKSKTTYAISLKMFKQLEKANLLIEEQKTTDAIEHLKELLEKRSSAYERAQIYSMLGGLYYKEGNIENALAAFTKVLESEGKMPELLQQQTLKTLAQLNMLQENYTLSRDYCEQLIAIMEEPKQLDYALLTQANYKLNDWSRALDAGLTGRKLAIDKAIPPDENLLLLINAVYFETEQMQKMVGVLEELIKYYPKANYVRYLASIYGQLDHLDKQTVLLESLYEDGKINKEAQLRNLASLYMSEKTPYKGAMLLQKEIDNGKVEASSENYQMLAQAWRLAAERDTAINAMHKAAELSDDGKLYLQAAYMHFDLANWQGATTNLKYALEKGLNEKHAGEAWLLMGMARFKLRHYASAIEACEHARKYPQSMSHAEQWITYISNERRKIESMGVSPD